MTRLLVTGASGFVGRAAVEAVKRHAESVRIALREPMLPREVAATWKDVDVLGGIDVGPNTEWSTTLERVDTVVHLAGRVHVVHDRAADPLADFRRVNVEGTLNLARQAALAGVRRFVFVSSIKVNGESTRPGRPYTAEDPPAPVDPYAISKHEAELGLRELAQETGLEVVVIRPPLVYGPGVKANFLAMMRWLNKGIPLPLGAVHNKRSLVAVGNLVDLIVTCLAHPAAANETFLVSDGEDLSTTELLRRMGQALGRPARLVPVPAGLLESGAALVGKRAVAQRLLGSLQVDIAKTRRCLDWSPPLTVEEGLRRTARGFLAE